MVNVGKYTIHGSYGIDTPISNSYLSFIFENSFQNKSKPEVVGHLERTIGGDWPRLRSLRHFTLPFHEIFWGLQSSRCIARTWLRVTCTALQQTFDMPPASKRCGGTVRPSTTAWKVKNAYLLKTGLLNVSGIQHKSSTLLDSAELFESTGVGTASAWPHGGYMFDSRRLSFL